MTFNESNTVEAYLRDLLAGVTKTTEETALACGLGPKGAGWRYVAPGDVPRQIQDVFVESWLRDALLRLNPEIAAEPDRADEVFYKHVHSALFGKSADGTTLEGWLRKRGIEEVLITGIRTEQCCETTARHASDSGFSVRYVTDATLTFPMTSRSGRSFSTAELRERTELVLDGRFARIVGTAAALG